MLSAGGVLVLDGLTETVVGGALVILAVIAVLAFILICMQNNRWRHTIYIIIAH